VRVEIDIAGGFPDGMAIDQDGGLWIALWGAGAVNHYSQNGRLVDTISVPGVSQVSSCAFGGTDGSTLYITTSRQGLPEDEQPEAGSVFAVQTSVRGAELAEFAG
jgi:sugar lactone lactonase YvrE